jgi:hypothetical protein
VISFVLPFLVVFASTPCGDRRLGRPSRSGRLCPFRKKSSDYGTQTDKASREEEKNANEHQASECHVAVGKVLSEVLKHCENKF